ncbi:hypothetical protein SAMN05421788_107122 [Filimonas lacunae]|uniref:Uncharacterized protein n=1 Tax=Filimonas lacunae TaxID=477680 RepID=A0A1N7QW04_9BACT|nr:hypothetical protein [Filimonas lacunae]SIT27048.1 hypothetical protein SAMN05421788_107122 [Filimonas lacunae]
MNDLYPELVDYIYGYCSQYQTPEELIAGRTLMYMGTSASEKMQSMMREKGWISEDPVILEMIADGYQAFKKRTVNRVWAQYRVELSLNLCPVCGKIARTPQARQCRFCYHDWH